MGSDTSYDALPIGVVETDLEHRVVRCNPAFAALVGLPAREVVGRSCWEFFASDTAEPDRVAVAEFRAGRRSSHSVARTLCGPDGADRAVQTDWALNAAESGLVETLLCAVTELNADKAADADEQSVALAGALAEVAAARDELARRQHFTDTLLETIDVGIVYCDADGANVVRNGAERRLLEFANHLARSDSSGDIAPLIDVLDPSGARLGPAQYPLARALRGETVIETDYRIGPRGGPHRDVVIRARRIAAADGSVLGAVVAVTDMTSERTALRELAAERHRLSEAQRLGQIGSFSYDVATDRFTFSREIYRIWGLPPDADLAALRREMIHPEDLPRVMEHWQAASRAGGEHSVEYRIVRPDGSVRHLRVSLEAHLDEAGNAVTLQGAHLDVTDLTVARLEAVEANALLRAILAASPDYMFVQDIWTADLVYGSPRHSVLGRTTEQLSELGVGRISALVHPDHQARLDATNLASRDLADEEVLQIRYRARHADGSWRWLDRRVTPFRRDPVTGRVREVLGVVRDVTDEHETELALRDQEARLRALITQVVDYAIVGVDPDGVVETWNDGAQRLKGYTAAEAIGQNFSMFHTEEDRDAGLLQRLLDEAKATGRAENRGWRVRADGTQFWADVVITALQDEQGSHTGFVKVTRDLTAQRRLEKAQESLFATVTHDLKTPIIAIKMFAELMADVDSETRLDYARRIAMRADHLGELVNDLFDYAKVRSQDTVSLEPVALTPFARQVVDSMGPALARHPVTVEASELAASADRTALHRVLENVLANAAKYSADGAPIRVGFEASGDLVRLLVVDQGRGIAPEDVDTIFDEFNRGRLAEDDGGTGLGLASVQRLATLQGGRAWIDSELGRGTTVTVELARAPDAP